MLVAALITAGVVGLLGAGPVSSSRVGGEQGLVAVEYRQVVHHASDEALQLVVRPTVGPGERAVVEMTGDWVAAVDVEDVTPAPAAQLLLPDGVRWEWQVAEPGWATIEITFRPSAYGFIEGRASVEGDTVTFAQFVMP